MNLRTWRLAGMLVAGMCGTGAGMASETAAAIAPGYAHAAVNRTARGTMEVTGTPAAAVPETDGAIVATGRTGAGRAGADVTGTAAQAVIARSRVTMPVPEDSIATLRLDLSRTDSLPSLLQRASLVIRAHPSNDSPSSYSTGRTAAGSAKVMHYVQGLHVLETLKGSLPAGLRLVLPGVDPQLCAADPLNAAYPGPLADDEAYVLFLQPTGLAGLYTLVGGRQGMYPIGDDGRTIALAGTGFAQLGGLTPLELGVRLRAAAPHL